MVNTMNGGEVTPGAWDHYELAEPYLCPWCGVEVTGPWKGFDGPQALLLWRQGVAAPAGRLWPDAPVGIDRSLFDDSRLPTTFHIASHCPDGHAVALVGEAPDGAWTTISSAVEQSRMLETYATQLPWTTWEALESEWPSHGAVTGIAASIEPDNGGQYVLFEGVNPTTGLSIAATLTRGHIRFDGGPEWTIVAADDPVVVDVREESGRLVMTARRLQVPTYRGNEELGYQFGRVDDAKRITVGAMTADLWRDDPWLPLDGRDGEAPLAEALASFNFVPKPFDREYAYALIDAAATAPYGQGHDAISSHVGVGISTSTPFAATILATHLALSDARQEAIRRARRSSHLEQ